MSRVMIVILIYNRHKPIDLIFVACACPISESNIFSQKQFEVSRIWHSVKYRP
jgi:hypothetical protein